MPFGRDLQGDNPCPFKVLWRRLPHTRGVYPMVFGQASRRSVVLCPTARATLDWQAQRFQMLKQGPSGRVYGGGVLQRFLGLIENLLEHLWFFCQEDLNILSPFGQIARFTGQTQIAEAIAALFGSRPDMLHLEGNAGLLAIATCPLPLFEQVLLDLVALERPLLVFQVADLRVFQRLQIEADQLLADSHDRGNAAQPFNPGHDVADSALQGWRKPVLSPSPVEKPWLTIARLALSSATPHPPALVQGFLDLRPPMLQVRSKNHFPTGIIDQGDACDLASRINLESQRFHFGALRSCFQNQSERVAFIHRRLSLPQQKPRIPWMDRI